MAVIAVVLAVIAIVVVALAIWALTRPEPAPPPPELDLAAPYRQQVAQDLEQRIYAEAAQHLDAEASATHAKEQKRE
jgi:predicted S18 family serine protease